MSYTQVESVRRSAGLRTESKAFISSIKTRRPPQSGVNRLISTLSEKFPRDLYVLVGSAIVSMGKIPTFKIVLLQNGNVPSTVIKPSVFTHQLLNVDNLLTLERFFEVERNPGIITIRDKDRISPNDRAFNT